MPLYEDGYLDGLSVSDGYQTLFLSFICVVLVSSCLISLSISALRGFANVRFYISFRS